MIFAGSAWLQYSKPTHVLVRNLVNWLVVSLVTFVPAQAQGVLPNQVQPLPSYRSATSDKPVRADGPLQSRGRKSYASHRPTLDVGPDATGHPVVYGLHNAEAAQGTRTQVLYGLNATGLFLNGGTRFVAGKLGLWDGGRVLTEHREFGGRVSMRNVGTVLNNHATHMAGTLVAAGLTPQARGMAYGASLAVWDYENDLAELTAAAPELLVSVHAYGPLSGWLQNLSRPGSDPNRKWEWWGNTTISSTDDYLFGFYSTKARDIDRLLVANPLLLMVRSADNKRAETGPPANTPYFLNSTDQQSTLPRSRNDAYDVIPGEATAKNVLTVGAGDVTLNGANVLTRLQSTPYSGWGPTDDGRIKPDLLGLGTGIYSTLSDGVMTYGTSTGTSMAAANVAGSLLLIQELHARQTNGTFLRAATLKGLAIHTADRPDPASGPDYRQGWGLLNTEAAAGVVQNASQAHLISEATLTQNQVWTQSVVAQGNEPLVVTLSWTDPEGTVSPLLPSSLNNRTPKLVNDLDVRVVAGSQSALPFALNPARPADAATRADNVRDNVEQVYVASPVAGQTYTIRVSHKGTIQSGSQPFAVLVSGRKHAQCQLPTLALLPRSDTAICAGNTLVLRAASSVGVRFDWLRDGVQLPALTLAECPVQEAGIYTVRYTDRNGCSGLSTPINVKLFSPAVQVLPVSSLRYLCPEQQPVQLVASVNQGATLSWLRNGVPLAGPAPTMLTVAQEGTYQAQATQNGCVGRSADVTVRTTTVRNVSLLPGNEVVQLPAGASIRLQAPAGNDYQYQWFRDKQLIASATGAELLVNQPGTYQLQVRQQQCIGWSAEKVVRRSLVTSVADSLLTSGADDSTFVAFPNPASATLHIRYRQPGGAAQVHVDVFDVAGKRHQTQFSLPRLANGFQLLELPVMHLPAGLYTLRLTDGTRRRSLRFMRR